MTKSDIFKLDGKICLVTGASRGIGESIAKLLAQWGRTDEALQHLDDARLDENDPHVAAGEVRALDKKGDHEAALARLEPFLDAATPNPAIALAFARICRHVDRCEQAAALLIFISVPINSGNDLDPVIIYAMSKFANITVHFMYMAQSVEHYIALNLIAGIANANPSK